MDAIKGYSRRPGRPGAREQRIYPRRDFRAEAVVAVATLPAVPYQIRGFCLGGMFLAFGSDARLQEQRLRSRAGRGDPVKIRFSAQVAGVARTYVLSARVARISGTGIGVAFIDPANAELRELESQLRAGRVHGWNTAGGLPGERAARDDVHAPVAAKAAEQILGAVRRRAAVAARCLYVEFLRATEVALKRAIDTAPNDQVRVVYEDTVLAFGKGPGTAEQAFVDDVLRRMEPGVPEERTTDPRQPGSSGGLALVEKDEFEEWLAIADTVTKNEAQFQQELFEISRRLERVAGGRLAAANNPLRPDVFIHALADSVHRVASDPAARRVCYEGLDGVVSERLGALYRELVALLTRVVPLAEAGNDGSGTGREEDARLGRQSPAPLTASPATTAQPAVAIPANVAPSADRDASAVVLDLVRLSRRAAASGCSTAPAPSSRSKPPSPVSGEEFIEILSRLQTEDSRNGEVMSMVRLKERILATLGHAGGAYDPWELAGTQTESIEAVDGLVESMLEDPHLDDVVKDWIRRLQIPVLKAALLDRDSLHAQSHPVRQLLNRLGRLGMQSSSRQSGLAAELTGAVTTVVQNLANEFDRDTAVFSRALARLDELQATRDFSYRGNVEQVKVASERLQRIARARRAVTEEVERRLRGRAVPAAVQRLLNGGWYALLLLSYVHDGSESAAWQEHLGVLDRLLMLTGGLGGDTLGPGSEAERLLSFIGHRLELIAYQRDDRREVLVELAELLGIGSGYAEVLAQAPLDPGPAAASGPRQGKLIGFEAVPKGLSRREWSLWLRRARRLEIGDWISLRGETGGQRFVRLVWIAEGRTSYAFVNSEGEKAAEFAVRELALALFAGAARVVEDADLPLMERASKRMLQKMHNRLTYLATHDQLTDLFNRKEFERRLEEALRSARAEGRQHVLCYLDLDQFKVVNNTCGHRAGDALLQQAARVFEDHMGREGTLARLGGDEFGLLLQDCSNQEGIEVVERQLAGLHGFRFEWGANRLSVRASAGLVPINDRCETVAWALNAADSSCFAAKESGRNRVHVYQADDQALARRNDEMYWILRVDEALDEERLVLRCQRIAPVQGPREQCCRYEVLLGVRDEKGQPLPLVPFVQTAEHYNRMPDVDRWVVAKTLKWIAAHPAVADSIAGFSINLSGNSLNDDHFVRFILEQFDRTKVLPSKVSFEITETFAIANIEHAVEFIRDVKRIGCTFSLDDFGSGLSSYSYLRNLPVDYLKIDGMFVKDIVESEHDYAVVKSINEIGHFMGKQTVAEYVHDEKVLSRLQEIGVDYAQGHGVEKPRLLDELAGSV